MSEFSRMSLTEAVKTIQSQKARVPVMPEWRPAETGETTVTSNWPRFCLDWTCSIWNGNAEGQPYIQYRGGPPGFLRKLDDKTLGFADFAGNRNTLL